MSRKPKSSQLRPTTKRARYTQEIRIKAVSMAIALGGVSDSSLQHINRVLNLNINKLTLSSWQTDLKPEILATSKDLSPNENLDVGKLVAETRQQLLVNMSSVAVKASKHLDKDSVIDAMSGRDAAVVTGIMAQRIIEVSGSSPEWNTRIKRYILACERAGRSAESLFEDILNRLDHEAILRENNTPQIKSTSGDDK